MKEMIVKHTLDPIIYKDSAVLILGSMPSVKSREQMFYYAHPQNRFWKVLSAVFEDDIVDKRDFCKRYHIALWDVIQECKIVGSSDTSIKNVIPNDLDALLSTHNIKMIFTTGSVSAKLFQKYFGNKYSFISLPSTSPANARMKLDDLIDKYKVIKDYAKE